MRVTRKRQTEPELTDAEPVVVVAGREVWNGLAESPDESTAETGTSNAERVGRQAATVGPVDTRSLLCVTITETPPSQSAT